jgi:hypothetical protein
MLNMVMRRSSSWGEILKFERAHSSFVCESKV